MTRLNNISGFINPWERAETSEGGRPSHAFICNYNNKLEEFASAKELTVYEHMKITELEPNSPKALAFDSLNAYSNLIWDMALDGQHRLTYGGRTGVYTAEQLCTQMTNLTHRWQAFRDQLHNES